MEDCFKYCFDVYEDHIIVLKGIMKKNGIHEAYLTEMTRSGESQTSFQVTMYSKSIDIDNFTKDCEMFDLKGPKAFNSIWALRTKKLVVKGD